MSDLITDPKDERYLEICSNANDASVRDVKLLTQSLYAALTQAEEAKRLLDEQVEATNIVTKELNACYAELGIYRHPDQPERGPDAIKRLREAVDIDPGDVADGIDTPSGVTCAQKNEIVGMAVEYIRRRAGSAG